MSKVNHNNYFDMIMYSAFKTLLMYDERKSLSYNQLHNYYLYIIDMVKIWIKKDNSKKIDEKAIVYFFNNYTDLNSEQEIILLERFLKNNELLFVKKDNEIYINNDITYKQLDEIIMNNFEHNYIFVAIYSQLRNLEALKILGADKLINELQELIKLEQMMEKLFENYDDNIKKLIKEINILNKHRMSKYFDKKSFECSVLRDIFDTITAPEHINYDISNNLFSDNLIENDLFYKNNPSLYEIFLDDTDIKLGLWFYSLFSDEKLYLKKIKSQLDDLILYKQSVEIYNFGEDHKNIFEENEEFEDEDYEEDYNEDEFDQYTNYIDEFDDEEDNLYDEISDSDDVLDDFMSPEKYDKSIFINTNASLKYIQIINDFENRFGYNEDLTKTKRRILYILNQYGYELYDDGNLPEITENILLEEDDNKHDYKEFYVHARLFLFDILVYNTFDETTLKKILFVSTYYDLTHDKRIERIIDKYSNTNIGYTVYRAIFNHESNLFIYSANKQKKL